jgi:hypothetical protein
MEDEGRLKENKRDRLVPRKKDWEGGQGVDSP